MRRRPASVSEVSESNRPRVGLVVVTYNAAAQIEQCLTSIAAQTWRPDRLFLVDNASQDDTRTRVASAATRLGLAIELTASSENAGFAAANNRAVTLLSDCDLIALLNPDAFPEPGWLAALVEAAAAHPEAASFASRLVLADDPTRLDGAGDVYHVAGLAWRFGHARVIDHEPNAVRARPVFSACGAAALYRRADWEAAGGFDERFFCYAEDVDLGFRLQLMDRQCWYVPHAIARHVGGTASGRDSRFAIYHGHRNLEWAFVKNMPARLLWRYLPLHLITSAGVVGWFLATGAGGTIVRAKWDALRGLRATLIERRRVQAARRISESALLAKLERTPLLRRLSDRLRQRQR
jgi:GT2 family glycosyltransferase